jgi:hypothetical protein
VFFSCANVANDRLLHKKQKTKNKWKIYCIQNPASMSYDLPTSEFDKLTCTLLEAAVDSYQRTTLMDDRSQEKGCCSPFDPCTETSLALHNFSHAET